MSLMLWESSLHKAATIGSIENVVVLDATHSQNTDFGAMSLADRTAVGSHSVFIE